MYCYPMLTQQNYNHNVIQYKVAAGGHENLCRRLRYSTFKHLFY